MPRPLSEYQRKRNFQVTTEPPAASGRKRGAAGQQRQYVIQKHDASHLHYDFRLELGGTLLSWAVPKGPSLDPTVKRLAVQVEDHPIGYADFEGHIPEGQYGGGDVIVWDRGSWTPVDADPGAAYRAGKLKFQLSGEKLSGGWTLVRTRLRGGGPKPQWLLIKEQDEFARDSGRYDVLEAEPDSVLSDATLPRLAQSASAGKVPAATGKKPSRKATRKTSAGAQASSGKNDRPLVAGVGISHPQRVIDPDSGVSKRELAEFYLSVADWLLPQLAGRPLSLVRAPDGVGGESFFQRHLGRLKMPHMRQLDKSLDPGHARLIQADNILAVIEAVQMGALELHTWNARSERIERPDRIIFDLDPDPQLPWSRMVEATHMTLDLLQHLGLRGFLKTSGGRGIHVVVPIVRRHGWDTVRDFSRAVTERLATEAPQRIAAKMGAQNRVGKIFVDYLRNQKSASTVAAYSVRARPGLPVSVPISREELTQIRGADQWNLRNLAQRLETRTSDPWAEYDLRQGINRKMLDMLQIDSESAE